jgi:hypothetical protein
MYVLVDELTVNQVLFAEKQCRTKKLPPSIFQTEDFRVLMQKKA